MNSIMVVDDNPVNLRYIEDQLSDAYQVIAAKSGEQALSICSRELPDLILLDIDMPGMSGFETIDSLKANTSFQHVPVIFLTANHDADTEIRGLESGAVDFITKPFEKRILLHRLELHLRISGYQRQLENTVRELSDSLGASFSELIECRDANTGGHVVRASRYVKLLGYELQKRGLFVDELSDYQVDMIVRAAPLHDIGKVSISDAILLKPSSLAPSEFDIMKEHTVLGEDILRAMFRRTPTQRYLQYAIVIAKSHHEKYNGTGYPLGKSGEEIPLCARIMAVADVYDALVSDRVYRKAISRDEAHSIIMAGRGEQFDPTVADVFDAIFDEISHETFSMN
ncbi:MAG: response regulator [Synergistaceae bacterium]|nr:response regulator [Synergistaceae bacterium]